MLIDILEHFFFYAFIVAVMLLEAMGFDPMGKDQVGIVPYVLIWFGLGVIIYLVGKLLYKKLMHKHQFLIIITRDESGMYLAEVPALPGCHTQAKKLTLLYKRIEEAIKLYLGKEPLVQNKFVEVSYRTISYKS